MEPPVGEERFSDGSAEINPQRFTFQLEQLCLRGGRDKEDGLKDTTALPSLLSNHKIHLCVRRKRLGSNFNISCNSHTRVRHNLSNTLVLYRVLLPW